MLKIYLSDFNGILTRIKEVEEFQFVENPRDADCLVLWQDVRGENLELCKINKEFLHKPVVVVQHGRGATRDYLEPNKFPMYADKFCCWGERDYQRLVEAGYGDKAVITGSPLIRELRPRIEHNGKNILFVPVITEHEEPENIIAYWELKRIELRKAQEVLRKSKDNLKEQWHSWIIDPYSPTENTIPFHVINKDWRLIAKITGVHDKRLYLGDVVQTLQANKTHIQDCIRLLTMVDCVVGMEEGTLQLLALAMNIPIVMIKGFSYRKYGGADYSKVEVIRTKSAIWTDLKRLEKTIDKALRIEFPDHKERLRVILNELGDLNSDPLEEIAKVIKSVV